MLLDRVVLNNGGVDCAMISTIQLLAMMPPLKQVVESKSEGNERLSLLHKIFEVEV